jgi:hypothetical protein
MISFDTNLLLSSLNQDCAEYRDARAFFASLPTAPGAATAQATTNCHALNRTASIGLTLPLLNQPLALVANLPSNRNAFIRSESVHVKNLFHVCPPFVRRTAIKRLLARLANGPPLLRGLVGSHLGHVADEISAGVFKVAEEVMPAIIQLAQINRVVLDMALRDHLQDLRPDGGMQLFVFLHLFRAEADD